MNELTIISMYSKENHQTMIKVVPTQNNEQLHEIGGQLRQQGYSALSYHKVIQDIPTLSTHVVLGL